MDAAMNDSGIQGQLSQISIELGKQSVQLAVMSTKLDAIPDHESRIRALERFRYAMGGIALVAGGAAGYVGYLIGSGH